VGDERGGGVRGGRRERWRGKSWETRGGGETRIILVELGAIYRLCVSSCLRVCTAFLKKVVSTSDCKITK